MGKKSVIIYSVMVFCLLVGAISVGATHKPGHKDSDSDTWIDTSHPVIHKIIQTKLMKTSNDKNYECDIIGDEIESKEMFKKNGQVIKPKQSSKGKYKPKRGEKIKCGDNSDIFEYNNKSYVSVEKHGVSTVFDVFVMNNGELVDFLSDIKIYNAAELDKWNYTNFTRTWDSEDELVLFLNSSHPLYIQGNKIYANNNGHRVYYDLDVVQETCWNYNDESLKRLEGSCLYMHRPYHGNSLNEVYIHYEETKNWTGVNLVEIDPAVYDGMAIVLTGGSTETCASIDSQINNDSLINWSASTQTCFLNASLEMNQSSVLNIIGEEWQIQSDVKFTNGFTNLGNLTIMNSNITRFKSSDQGYGFDNLENSTLMMDNVNLDYFGQSETFTQCISIFDNTDGYIKNSNITSRSGGCSITIRDRYSPNVFDFDSNVYNAENVFELEFTIYNSQNLFWNDESMFNKGNALAIPFYFSNSSDFEITDSVEIQVSQSGTALAILLDVFTKNGIIKENIFKIDGVGASIGITYTKTTNISAHNNFLEMNGSTGIGFYVVPALSLLALGQTNFSSVDISVYDNNITTRALNPSQGGTAIAFHYTDIIRCDGNEIHVYGESFSAYWVVNATAKNCDNGLITSEKFGYLFGDALFTSNDTRLFTQTGTIFSQGSNNNREPHRFTNLTGNDTFSAISLVGANDILYQYYLTFLVQDNMSNPQQGVNIDAFDNDSLQIFSEMTNANGLTNKVAVNTTLFFDNQSLNYTPHEYFANDGFTFLNEPFNMTTNLFIILSNLDSDMMCVYEPEPNVYLTDNKAEWYCFVNQNMSCGKKCHAKIIKDGNLVEVSPKYEFVRGFGNIENFEVKNGVVHTYFDLDNVYAETKFDFEVSCGLCDFSAQVKPIYNQDPTNKIIERTIWSGRNARYIILALSILAFFAILIKISE